MVDRGAASAEHKVAKDSKLVPSLDARLVLIDAANGIDKFCVLQGLKGPDGFYSLIRQGNTGDLGDTQIKGPLEKAEVEKLLADAFKEKTGHEWGTITPGDRAKPGMYWLQKKMTTNVKAQWQYYVDDGVDGKRVAWYDYHAAGSDEVEEIYAQHVSNQGEKRTNERIVKSGHFSYKIDLDNKTQTNTRTNKVRTIRRIMCERKAMKAMKAVAMKTLAMKKVSVKTVKSMKKAKKKPVKKVMKAMKAMKAMKKVSTIAKGPYAKAAVFAGHKLKTKKGLTKDMLTKSASQNKIVSKRSSARSKKAYSHVKSWNEACQAARKSLALTGFVAVGGKTAQGKALYAKAREIYKQ